VSHPDLLVGFAGSDDAAIFRVGDDTALVQTVDFFTPIVDDAYDWGRIAAANALSDVYAMGGDPLTALQLVSWPRDGLDRELLASVIRGGADIMAEAGCTIVGGHSIDDSEPKYGFAVTGLVPPDEVMTNADGEIGDVLFLTKPIGTGIIATALKREAATDEAARAATESMVTLNRAAARAARRIGVRTATDVTGFGLLGHLAEIVRASHVSAVLDPASVPLLPDVTALVDAGMVSGGTKRNLAAVRGMLDPGAVSERDLLILADAQTSGGLLLAIEPALAAALEQALADEGIAGARIGSLVSRRFEHGPSGQIILRPER
jgi:selenide,water dikinase